MEDIQLYFHCPEGWDDGKNSPTETSTTSAVGQAAEVNEIDHRHVTHVVSAEIQSGHVKRFANGKIICRSCQPSDNRKATETHSTMPKMLLFAYSRHELNGL